MSKKKHAVNLSSGITNIVRPKSLKQVIGLDKTKNIIEISIQGCFALKKPVPHFLITGPTGTGKTTLAEIIASFTKGKVHKLSGTDLGKVEDVYDLAINCKDNDVVFIEEAHTIGGSGRKAKIVQQSFYEWMEDYKISAAGAAVAGAPKVSFVFATTDPGLLAPPLRNRCINLSTSYYSVDQMKVILAGASEKLNLNVKRDDDALTLLAQSSRGMPRIAIMHRLDSLLNFMAAKKKTTFSLSLVKEFFKNYGIHEYGLEANDLVYCNTLYEKLQENGGKGISKMVMAQSTGFAVNMLDSQIESYLLQMGIIQIAQRGRIFTPKGYEILGKAPVSTDVFMDLKKKQINVDELKKMLENPEICKMGMQPILESFGLKYTSAFDRAVLKEAMDLLGYTVRARAGIVPK